MILRLLMLLTVLALSACASAPAKSDHPVDKSTYIDGHDFRFGGYMQTGGQVRPR